VLCLFRVSCEGPTSDLLHWHNVHVHLSKGNRTILQLNKEGGLKRGRLTALIGPSGCGKTTFLSLIAGKLWSTSKTTALMGPLRIDSDVGPTFSGSEVAFVYQDDSFFSMLTVFETLKLTANLRLLNHTTEQRKLAIVDVMNSMALTAVADIAVGDATGTRGISGGERKRLAVACELLSKPKLLVADEPTSGLDSFQAQSVVRQLKLVVDRENLVGVITLHQPRSSIWALLDDIILLAPNGRLVYHGPRADAIAYFQKIGFPSPANTNPAEHLIDLVSVDLTSELAKKESDERIDKLVEAFALFPLAKQNGDGSYVRELPEAMLGVEKKRSTIFSSFSRVFRSGTRMVRTFGLLLQRATRQTLRDGGVNIVRFGVSALLALVVGSVYGKQHGPLIDEDSVGDRVTIIAQAAIQVSMLAMLKTLQLFKKERSVVVREIATRQYGSFEYLLSKAFAELPVDALVAAFFAIVLHERTNLRCQRSQFVSTLSLLACASSSLGLAISALSPTGEIALAVGPALMVVYVISGSIGPGKAKVKVSWILQALRNASPIRPACEALCVAEFANQPLTKRNLNPLRRFVSLASRVVIAVWRQLRQPDIVAPGDYVLQDLGITDHSPSNGKRSLGQLLLAHFCFALVGLLISNKQ